MQALRLHGLIRGQTKRTTATGKQSQGTHQVLAHGKHFRLHDEAQFDLKAALTASPGVHVIAGPNNSGKTRLLHALGKARVSESVPLTTLDSLVPNLMELVHGRYNQNNHGWDNAARLSITFTWDRDGSNIAYEADSPELATAMSQIGFNSGPLTADFAIRRVRIVQTNRHFSALSNLTNKGSIDDLQNAITYLENLNTSTKSRSTYTQIRHAFTDITEGLDFETYQGDSNPLERTLYIREPNEKGAGREIGACGDGLRDLVLLIANAVSHPHEDLLLDEPGLRLHGRTQQRLIAFLNREAQEHAKSVYVATHDEGIINSPIVGGRYFVRREPPKSIVKGIEDARAIWSALRELGTEPSRLVGHSGVIVCEGETDVVIFSMILDWIRELSPEAGFFAVEHLEGDGNIVKGHRRVFDVLRRAMPFGDIGVLLDKTGSAPPKEREVFADYCDKNRIHHAELIQGDIEDYFTLPIFDAVLVAMGFDGNKSEILKLVSEVKGLARFELAAQKLQSNRLKDKRQIANCVAGLDRTLIETELAPLVKELREFVEAVLLLAKQSKS